MTDLAQTYRATRITSATPAMEPLSGRALAEIARVMGLVDMKSMPDIPASAPCRADNADPEDWHDPFRGLLLPVTAEYKDKVAEQLCRGCPVLAECLLWALANPHQGGILGGMTEKARGMLRRGTRRKSARTRLTVVSSHDDTQSVA